MVKVLSIAATLTFVLMGQVHANVVGTEYQNFAPTYSGLDFTTVESSETLKPCMCSLGLFFNYAKNTLTYSDTYYSSGPDQDLTGKRANDFLVGADLLLGFGITKNWDFGLVLPFVVTARNDDPYGVSYFEKFGLTEVRPMTKFRFYGDDTGGLAIGVSANFNVIQDNPFAGRDPGATINFQLIGDTTFSGGTKLAANVGYRKRNSGPKIIDVNPIPPFVPFKDSWIFSLALAERFESINSDLIVELLGSHSGKLDESDSARQAQQALEMNLGLRNDFSKTVNIHGGLGTKFANAQASPDIRAYLGVHMQFGPVCETRSQRIEIPTAVVNNAPIGTSLQRQLDMPVTAKNMVGYRWKIGSTPQMNCTSESGYSDEIPGELTIQTDIGEIPDGGITLCALAKNDQGIWQPLNRPTIVRWIKASEKPKATPLPVAVITQYPRMESEETELSIPVTALDPNDYEAYRWKIGPTTTTKCQQEAGYSEEMQGTEPAITTIKDMPDGGITMCAVAKNLSGKWQPFSRPTIVRWIKRTELKIIQKEGYELFRLSAEVLFDFDKDEIRPGAQRDLERISTYLKKRPFKKVIIEGHTDSKGSDSYNLDLSQRRAQSVKKWLVNNYNFVESQFQAVGKGERFPVATNTTDAGRQLNRRVEFKIYR